MFKKLVVLIVIAVYMLNNLAYAYTENDYLPCEARQGYKCKIVIKNGEGYEYVMLDRLTEGRYSDIVDQTAGVPIIIFPAQLKYPIQLPDGSYLGKEAPKGNNNNL